jgi:hypothetical protein
MPDLERLLLLPVQVRVHFSSVVSRRDLQSKAQALADAFALSREAFMFADSQPLLEDYHGELYRWTAAWYVEVVEAGLMRSTFQPDDQTISRLHAYFDAGLSPSDAAQAIFGEKH